MATMLTNMNKISNADQECVSFLMTLKHRAVTPPATTATTTTTTTRAAPNQKRKLSLLEGKNDSNSANVTNENGGSTASSTNANTSTNSNSNSNTNANSTQSRYYQSQPQPRPHSHSSDLNSLTGLPIATEDDAHFLSEYMCFIRSHCCEFFISEVNMNMNMNLNRNMNMNMNIMHRNQGQGQDQGRGYSYNNLNAHANAKHNDRNSSNSSSSSNSNSSSTTNTSMSSPMPMQVSAGRVGIRCRYSKHTSTSSSSISFPSDLAGIYGATMMLVCQHVAHCPMVPIEVRGRLEALQRKEQQNSNAMNMNMNMSMNMGIKQYWIDSAKRLGLYDTPDGIRFHHQQQQQHQHRHYSQYHRSFFPSNSNMNRSINAPVPSSAASFPPFQVQGDQNMNMALINNNDPKSNTIGSSHGGNYCNTTSTINNTATTPSSRSQSHNNNNNVAYDCFDSVEDYHRFHSTTNCSNVSGSVTNAATNTTPNDNTNIASTPRGRLTSTQPNKVSPEVTSSNSPYHYHNNNNNNRDSNSNSNNRNLHTTIAQSHAPPEDEYSIEKIEQLMGETKLVEMHDKDLVPDYLFLAMAQMKPCHLTEADRVGCYKERELGFLGMSCKHCGGQPGFGKYFPATVRSLAQTTTSQTIVKHIAVKCRLCPPEVRLAVLALQLEQANKDRAVKDANGSSFESRPRYGSRKIFFNRLWGRLHGGDVPVVSRSNSAASDGASSGSEGGNRVGAMVSSPSSSTSMTAVGGARSTSSTVDTDSNNAPTAAPMNRKNRSAVVSPHFEESLICPTKFSTRWPSIARHMMKSQESKNTGASAASVANDNHNQDTKQGSDFRQQSNAKMNPNEKRSRAVSYVDDERRHAESYQRRKMNPMVSHY